MEVRLRSFSSVPGASARRPLLDRAFLEHPRSLGESYWQHQQRAMTFGVTMILAGIACAIHALIPVLFEHSASTAVVRLHERMRTTRRLGR
jgi:Family of unknown function (DUF6356)